MLLTEEFKREMKIDENTKTVYILYKNNVGFLLYINEKTLRVNGFNFSALLKANYPPEGIQCFACNSPAHNHLAKRISPLMHVMVSKCVSQANKNADRIKAAKICPYGVEKCDVTGMSLTDIVKHVHLVHPEHANLSRALINSDIITTIKMNAFGPIYFSRLSNRIVNDRSLIQGLEEDSDDGDYD